MGTVRHRGLWLLVVGIVATDQLVKHVLRGTAPLESTGVSFRATVNTEGFLGLSIPNPILIVITAVICLLLGVLIRRGSHHRSTALGLWLLLAGAFSNLLDRIFIGGVIDVLSFGGSPKFNLADVVIVLGAAALLKTLWTKP